MSDWEVFWHGAMTFLVGVIPVGIGVIGSMLLFVATLVHVESVVHRTRKLRTVILVGLVTILFSTATAGYAAFMWSGEPSYLERRWPVTDEEPHLWDCNLETGYCVSRNEEQGW